VGYAQGKLYAISQVERLRSMKEVFVFSDKEKDVVPPEELIKTLVHFFAQEHQKDLKVRAAQLRDTSYVIRIEKVQSEFSQEFRIEIYDPQQKVAFPCYLDLEVNEDEVKKDAQDIDLTVFGYYVNRSKGKFRNVSALLSLYDDAMCQAMANYSQRRVVRHILTQKKPIIDLMVKRAYTIDEEDMYSRMFIPKVDLDKQ